MARERHAYVRKGGLTPSELKNKKLRIGGSSLKFSPTKLYIKIKNLKRLCHYSI